MDKQAYLIMAHRNESQLALLLSKLDDERFDIYVHIDARSRMDVHRLRQACCRSRLIFTERLALHWGGPSLVRAELLLLAEATRTPHSFYHLISGMDMPLKSPDAIFSFFDTHRNTEFLQLKPVSEESRRRYTYPVLWPECNHNPLARILKKAWHKACVMLDRRINQGITFYHASQWFSITEQFAQYIVSQEDWVMRTFHQLDLCDEVFVATLLYRGQFQHRLYSASMPTDPPSQSGHLRYEEWVESRHPRTFTFADYPRLSALPHFWARKFDQEEGM